MKRLLVALRSATAWRQPAAARRTHKGNPRPCNRAANCQAGRRGPIAAISGPATIDDALPRSTNPNPHPLYVALVADRAAPLPRRPLSHFFFCRPHGFAIRRRLMSGFTTLSEEKRKAYQHSYCRRSLFFCPSIPFLLVSSSRLVAVFHVPRVSFVRTRALRKVVSRGYITSPNLASGRDYAAGRKGRGVRPERA